MGEKTRFIELRDGSLIPILYEDRSVIAIDKPPGWMLIPFTWQKTNRNLQAAITSSIAARDFWARSRDLKQLMHVHRLDAETTGALLFAKSKGALEGYSRLFESRKIDKVYLAVVDGVPARPDWVCRLPLAPDPKEFGKIRVDKRSGKHAETQFRVLMNQARPGKPQRTLLEARPITGRTHQIRVHLTSSGTPVTGDDLYGISKKVQPKAAKSAFPLALRSILLSYSDPFTNRQIRIEAPWKEFVQAHGFDELDNWSPASRGKSEMRRSS